jgi:hypothetical protein
MNRDPTGAGRQRQELAAAQPGREWQGAKAKAGLTIEFVGPSSGEGRLRCFFVPSGLSRFLLIPRAEFVVFRVAET